MNCLLLLLPLRGVPQQPKYLRVHKGPVANASFSLSDHALVHCLISNHPVLGLRVFSWKFSSVFLALGLTYRVIHQSVLLLVHGAMKFFSFLFCMWIANFPSNFRWKRLLLSTELLLYLYQKSYCSFFRISRFCFVFLFSFLTCVLGNIK